LLMQGSGLRGNVSYILTTYIDFIFIFESSFYLKNR
jgi:hypothetical protein